MWAAVKYLPGSKNGDAIFLSVPWQSAKGGGRDKTGRKKVKMGGELVETAAEGHLVSRSSQPRTPTPARLGASLKRSHEEQDAGRSASLSCCSIFHSN